MMVPEKKIINWYPEGIGFIFMFARDKEAYSVKVDFQNGTIDESQEKELRKVSDTIVKKGIPEMDIRPFDLMPISKEDYLSEEYTHPVDSIMEEAHNKMKEHGLGGADVADGPVKADKFDE